jgi:asparagine synthase (glutamine-hydrolysing)
MQGPFVDAHHHVVDALFAACTDRGCRVVLTGLRGDDVFGGLAYLADRARRLRVRGLRAELDAWSPIVGAPSGRLLWALCLRPWLEWARPLKQVFEAHALPAARTQPPKWRGFGSLAREEAHRLALGPFTALSTELFELNAASHGLVAAYPFWDRRVVEFALALPQERRAGAGVTKRVLRDAMVGVMPETNRLRTDKLSLTQLFRRGLTHEDRERVVDAVTRLHPAVADMVRIDRLPRLLDDLLEQREVPLLQIWFLICSNLWLRQLDPDSPLRSA